MTVYVHTTVENEREAEEATQQLLDAGFVSRDIHVIERQGGTVRRTRLGPRSHALIGAGMGTALGAILGSLVFTQPQLWGADMPQVSISLAAALGALFGLVAGGLTGLGQLRTVPKFDHPPSAIAVGVHTEVPRVARAASALRSLGRREVLAGTELDAAERLTGASTAARS